jgi:hypothetical protein
LEHIIRAAGNIADDNEIIILGGASIFAQFPNLPDRFLLSVEAAVFPKNMPQMTDIIDGSLEDCLVCLFLSPHLSPHHHLTACQADSGEVRFCRSTQHCS